MSIKGFSINGVTQRYDYTALDNKPNIPAGVVVDTALNANSTNAVQNQAIASAIGDLSNLDTTAKSNLVAAINEAAQSGGSGGISDELKQALLQLAQKVAYIDSGGQSYYQDLYDALYPSATLTSITANFNQGSTTIYTTDTLDSLRPMLVVTALYDDATTRAVTDYTLSGSLTAGTSVITASYGGKTDTFSVTVTGVSGTYSITNNLTGCINSNAATTIADGASYTGTITANTGYTLTGATVNITMGGTSVTGYYSNGTISIPNVTGDVVITVVATARVLSSISAVFTQGDNVIYDTDSLDTLKQYLVVTASYNDSTTAIVPSADYTLSGTLEEGTSTITASYGGKTATFNVTVTDASNYVDNGLICHLDGIDNTGSGHDSNATTWKDLVGSYDITTLTGGTWDNNGLSFNGASSQIASAASIFPSSENMTIEMVIAPSGTGTQMLGSFDTISGSSKRFALYLDNTVGFVGQSGKTFDNSESSLTEIKTIAAVYSNFTVLKGLINNTQVSLSTKNHSFSRGTGKPMVLANVDASDGTKYPYNGKIMSLRVYNRALTDSELAQNHATDVARFNLGA